MRPRDGMDGDYQLSVTSRKALAVHLGEAAGREVAELLQRLTDRIEHLERSKVDVMPVVRQPAKRPPAAARTRRTA